MAVESERVRRRGRAGRGLADRGRAAPVHAARALAVTALALVLAALLNAQSIYKSVYNQPEGTQREVALAFAGPLREVSMALRLDRPRAWVESAIGREHATIDTEIVLPPPPPPTATTPVAGPAAPGCPTGERTPQPPSEPEEPERVVFTPRDRMRLWIAGDSLVITPGYAIFRAFGRNEAVREARRRRRPRGHRPHAPRRLQLVPPRGRAGREAEDRHRRLQLRRRTTTTTS